MFNTVRGALLGVMGVRSKLAQLKRWGSFTMIRPAYGKLLQLKSVWNGLRRGQLTEVPADVLLSRHSEMFASSKTVPVTHELPTDRHGWHSG